MPRFLPNEMTAGPPPAVLLELDIAWERSREMFASDLELHFEVDQVHAEVWANSGSPTAPSSSGSPPPRRSRSPAATSALRSRWLPPSALRRPPPPRRHRAAGPPSRGRPCLAGRRGRRAGTVRTMRPIPPPGSATRTA